MIQRITIELSSHLITVKKRMFKKRSLNIRILETLFNTFLNVRFGSKPVIPKTHEKHLT